MSKQVIRPHESSFVFQVTFEHLLNAIQGTQYRISKLLDDNAVVLLTGIDENNEIKFSKHLLFDDNFFDQIQYAKLLIALDMTLLALKEHVTVLSRTGCIIDQKKFTPVLRFKNNIVVMEQLGIQPWHHLFFSGDKVYVYVWDTRIVEKVINVEDCKCLTKRMFVEAADSNLPLMFTPETEQFKNDFEAMMPSMHKMFSGDISIVQELQNYVQS